MKRNTALFLQYSFQTLFVSMWAQKEGKGLEKNTFPKKSSPWLVPSPCEKNLWL